MGSGDRRWFLVLEGPTTVSFRENNVAQLGTKENRRYFKKFERYIPHPDYPLVDASVHGRNGPIRVGYNNYVSNPSRAFIKSCVSVGIPFTPDFNGPNGTLGVSRVGVTSSR